MREQEEALISVIVPVYNGQNYLEGCIKSIENQTYKNMEIIIVNDGSTDDTGKVCALLQEQYSNVQVITLDDKGVSAARNVGMEAVKGEYITFVDADDRLCPGMLQILYDCLLGTQSDIAGCQFFCWKNEAEWEAVRHENTGKTRSVGCDTESRSGGNDREEAYKTNVFSPDAYVKEAILQGNSRCWSKLYRRNVLHETHFREGLTIGEDMLFLIDLLPHVRRIAEMEYQGYGYFQNPGGTINRGFTPRYMDQITCWELVRDEILKRNPERGVQEQVSALLMVGIMLTVGKIAVLPLSERKKQKRYTEICHRKLKENLAVAGAYGRLSKGYQLKVRLFQFLPEGYLILYHGRKNKGK